MEDLGGLQVEIPKECPFLQSMKEMLGEEVVQNYLGSLGETAMADMHAENNVSDGTGPLANEATARTEISNADTTPEAEPDISSRADAAMATEQDLKPPEQTNLEALHTTTYDAEPDIELSAEQFNYVLEDATYAEPAARQAVEEAFARQLIRDENISIAEAPTDVIRAESEQASTDVHESKTRHLQVTCTQEAAIAEDENQAQVFERPVLTLVQGGSTEPAQANEIRNDQSSFGELPNIENNANNEVTAIKRIYPELTSPETVRMIDIETLLLPLDQFETFIAPEFERQANESEEAAEPPVFTERIAALVAHTVVTERQPAVWAMLKNAYDLIDVDIAMALETTRTIVEGDETLASEANELLELELTLELEAIATKLLQELGIKKPTPEQVEQFIMLIRAEKSQVVHAESSLSPVDIADQEQSHGFTASVWQRYQHFLHLHQPLGGLALTQPTTA